MYTSTARTIDTPPPGTPAYSAYLAARQMALGLTTADERPAVEPARASVVVEEPASVIEPETPPAPAPIVAPPVEEWVWVGPVERVPAGPGCVEGSVLGCGLGRDHHCHWIWYGRVGRFCCHKCEPGLWEAIPKAKHDPKW